jgi:tyrosinase
LAVLGDTAPPKNPRQDGYGYNPRCIKRDISGYLVQRDATPAKTAALITNSKTVGSFQDTMQSMNGVHTAGHFTVSGDPGSGKLSHSTLAGFDQVLANARNRLLRFTR